MKYNNVTVDQVISKVMADLDISEDSQRIDDYIEWAAEAMELIGAPVQMDTVTNIDNGSEPIPVVGYQCRIPNDVTNILSVYHCDSKNGSYAKIFPSTSINRRSTDPDGSIFYYIKPGYICLNKDGGYINIVYQTYHRDSSGMIMIPNLISYIEAIYWYIVMKLSYPKWRLGQLRDQVYYDAKKSWRFFRNKAYGEMMMPTLDEMSHNIKNTWNRLVPQMNEEYTDFNNISKQEKVRF